MTQNFGYVWGWQGLDLVISESCQLRTLYIYVGYGDLGGGKLKGVLDVTNNHISSQTVCKIMIMTTLNTKILFYFILLLCQ